MDRDLFLSIMAMDSYNRGYDRGLAGLSDAGWLGKAKVTFDSLVLGGTSDNRVDASAGFYAIAYNWGGQKIISYRGTGASLRPLEPTAGGI